MKEGNTIFLEDSKGVKHPYKLIVSFMKDDKNIIVYTENEEDEDGFIKTYAGIYANKKGKEVLLPVDNDEDLQMIEELLANMEKGIN